MRRIRDALAKSGLISIGLCSTLWIAEDGAFRGGFFRQDGVLNLALTFGDNRFWIAPVSTELVEMCLQGQISLFNLANETKCSYIIVHNRLTKPGCLARFHLWRSLNFNPPRLLPNSYYIWREYIFEQE